MDALPLAHDNQAGSNPDMPNGVKAEPVAATSSDARDFVEKTFLPCMQRENSVAATSMRVFSDLVDSVCVEVAYECIRLQSIGAFSSKDHITPAVTKFPAASCPHCGASVGITKFIPHLATCMNIGGRRRVRPNTLTASRDGNVSPSEFDFGSEDDDTTFGSRKRKVGHSNKVKNGESKTYGSKGKNRAALNTYVPESVSQLTTDPFEFF